MNDSKGHRDGLEKDCGKSLRDKKMNGKLTFRAPRGQYLDAKFLPMPLPSIFTPEVGDQVIARINQLTPQSKPIWGKMNVAQMLAHCNVTYEMTFDHKHAKPNGFARFLLKLFVKKTVVSETPYTKNSRTAPAFLIVDERVYETEKERLIQYIRKVYHMGAGAFEGKESHSFGPLTSLEYNNMFYKHLDHHLSQFGV